MSLRQRDPRQRDAGYLSALHDCPCVVCVKLGVEQTSLTEAAHVKTGYPRAGAGWRDFGVQEKSHDWRAVPLCGDHHRLASDAQHNRSETSFWEAHGIYPPDLVRNLRLAWDNDDSLACAARVFVRNLGAIARATARQTVVGKPFTPNITKPTTISPEAQDALDDVARRFPAVRGRLEKAGLLGAMS